MKGEFPQTLCITLWKKRLAEILKNCQAHSFDKLHTECAKGAPE
jgi:hypothetical protein